MRTALGYTLIFAGAAIVCYGMYLALGPLLALYQGAMADPLADPVTGEAETPRAMFGGLAVAAIGLPPLIAGTVLVRVARTRRR